MFSGCETFFTRYRCQLTGSECQRDARVYASEFGFSVRHNEISGELSDKGTRLRKHDELVAMDDVFSILLHVDKSRCRDRKNNRLHSSARAQRSLKGERNIAAEGT